jgi:lipopolysaccharide transport system ATP-binding protein
MSVAIQVEGLGKSYQLGASKRAAYGKFSDALVAAAKAPFTKREPAVQQTFWALRDVSFEVAPGERLGIIGRNGAGKSTLLKILSRITQPTTGRVKLCGQVASLLEVGTGFHPELTGRENIFLNGAILGMKRAEIQQRFDEIVAFAEVERFLDTPVKRYSSGMAVRLAFAVAAHLQPEILVIDEVLAVGDIAFQNKCLGKMQEVTQKSDRTLLFVSHNLSAVRQLTTRCLVLEAGQLVFAGAPEQAIAHYLERQVGAEHEVARLPRMGDCTGDARFTALRHQVVPACFAPRSRVSFIAEVEVQRSIGAARVSLSLIQADGQLIGSGFSVPFACPNESGLSEFTVTLTLPSLAPGRYHLALAIGSTAEGLPVNHDAITDVLPFEVVQSAPDGRTPSAWQAAWGALQLPEVEVQLAA